MIPSGIQITKNFGVGVIVKHSLGPTLRLQFQILAIKYAQKVYDRVEATELIIKLKLRVVGK